MVCPESPARCIYISPPIHFLVVPVDWEVVVSSHPPVDWEVVVSSHPLQTVISIYIS